MARTIEQRRADFAWINVSKAHEQAKQKAEAEQHTARDERVKQIRKALEDFAGGGKNFKKSYSSLARSIPALLQTDGLGQTLAFLRAKGKDKGWDAHTRLYEHLSDWVVRQLRERNINLQDQNDLLGVVCKLDSRVYRMAVVEALAYLRWIKRFAEAELPEPEGGGQ